MLSKVMQMGNSSAAGSSTLSLPSTDVIKASMEGPFAEFWAVEDPLIVQDSIPRDLENNLSKLNSPTRTALQMFGSFEAAAAFAQRQNKTLLILNIKVEAKVLPQLPLVQKIKAA